MPTCANCGMDRETWNGWMHQPATCCQSPVTPISNRTTNDADGRLMIRANQIEHGDEIMVSESVYSPVTPHIVQSVEVAGFFTSEITLHFAGGYSRPVHPYKLFYVAVPGAERYFTL